MTLALAHPAGPLYLVPLLVVYALREPDGSLRTEQDRHVEGLFSRAEWLEVLQTIGFEARPMRFDHTGENGETEGFLGRRP